MSIHEDVKGNIQKAMLAKESTRLSVLRGLLSAFTNELVAKGKKPQEMLTDDEALAVIRRSVKQRKESIDQFTKGGREDLAKGEAEELTVLESFLPQMMSTDEIKKIAEAKKAALGITDKAKAGILIGAVIKETKGQADGGEVKRVVEELLG